MNVFKLFAQLEELNPFGSRPPLPRGTSLVFLDVLPIIGVGLALGLILLLWVKIQRRQGRRRRHHHGTSSANSAAPLPPGVDGDDEPASPRRARRKRRRRRDHRPRNPTLAETGGLPSSKTESSSNPPV